MSGHWFLQTKKKQNLKHFLHQKSVLFAATAFGCLFLPDLTAAATLNQDRSPIVDEGDRLALLNHGADYNNQRRASKISARSRPTPTRAARSCVLKDLLSLLGISSRRDSVTATQFITLKDGVTIVFDSAKLAYLEYGHSYDIAENEVITNDDVIYVNVSLLNRMLPTAQFVVDQAARQIASSGLFCGTSGEACRGVAPASDIAPAPQAAPVSPVVVDDLASPAKAPAAVVSSPPNAAHPEGDVIQMTQTTPAKAAPPKTERGAETGEDLLILQPRIKKLATNGNFIEALDIGGVIFVPLNDFVQLIGFSIKVDSAAGTARGFFYQPENKFILDFAKRELQVGSRHPDLTSANVRLHEGEIYVSTLSIEEWFDIHSEVDRKTAIIIFTTDKLLPGEERDERQKRWQGLLTRLNDENKDAPVLQNPYKAVGYPVFDVNIGSEDTHTPAQQGGQSTSTTSNNYTIQGAGDLGYMTTQTFIQGSDITPLNTFRVDAGRKDPGANLLGGMHATEFDMGDVASPSLTLVTSNSLGEGVNVTNRDLQTTENFDVRSFTGNAVPGYQVELYRNDVLIAFQTVDNNGRYNFVDIPILYGDNVFRIVLYGPEGQREERIETVSASNALLKSKQLEYTFGLEQRGSSLLPISNNTNSSTSPDGTQAVAGFRYGLTSGLTAGAATAETMLPGGEHRYMTTTVGANIFSVLTEADYAKDVTNNGTAAGLTALAGFEGISLRARYRQYDNFVSEAINNTTTPLSSETSFDANTQADLPLIGDLTIGGSALRQNFVDNATTPTDTYSFLTSKSLWGLSFSNTANYIVNDTKMLTDTFGVQTRVSRVDLRAVGTYDLKPVQQFQTLAVTADYRLTDRLAAESQLNKNIAPTDSTSVTQTSFWDFDEFRLGFNGQADNRGAYSVGFNLLFSVFHNPLTHNWQTQPQPIADSGAVAGHVYTAQDKNDPYNDGAAPQPDAKVKVNSMTAPSYGGNYLITPVAPYENARIELDPESIKDPLLTPVTKSYKAMTRPGDMIIADFPLVMTTIIEGNVTLLDEQGHQTNLKDIVVELQDKTGKPLRRLISEFEGYFSFDKVEAGEYWLNVPDDALAVYNAVLTEKPHIVITKVDEFITDKSIVLRVKPKGDAPTPVNPADVLPSAPAVPAKPDDDVKPASDTPDKQLQSEPAKAEPAIPVKPEDVEKPLPDVPDPEPTPKLSLPTRSSISE